jgi:hypothetical protein
VRREVAGVASMFQSHAAAFPTSYSAQPRSTRTLNGFFAGVERRQADGAPDYVLTRSGDPVNTALSTDATRNVAAANFALVGASGQSVVLGFGETEPAGRSAFVDDRTFVATAASFQYDGAPIAGRGGLATSAFLEHGGLLPPGVSFCECDYLLWGFATAERPRTAASPAGDRNALALATFVAGALSDAAQLAGLPALTATYEGHLIANVAHSAGGQSRYYTAVGGLSLAFEFGGGDYALSSVAISSFDGVSLSGTGSSASFSGNRYSNSGLAVTGVHPKFGALAAKLDGAFFGPGAPPANTAGQVLITGAGYTAAGTYGAKLTGQGPPLN